MTVPGSQCFQFHQNHREQEHYKEQQTVTCYIRTRTNVHKQRLVKNTSQKPCSCESPTRQIWQGILNSVYLNFVLWGLLQLQEKSIENSLLVQTSNEACKIKGLRLVNDSFQGKCFFEFIQIYRIYSPVSRAILAKSFTQFSEFFPKRGVQLIAESFE